MAKTGYIKKSVTLWRSYENDDLQGESDPWKLLCSAIIFQAAADADAIRLYGEGSFDLHRYAKGAMDCMTKKDMVRFINSDWLDSLLSWQRDISVDSVAENLYNRLMGVRST